ncbi:hypothetical protein BC834DRAFT_1015953, partial [Gloeopeniophorella convolvens]
GGVAVSGFVGLIGGSVGGGGDGRVAEVDGKALGIVGWLLVVRLTNLDGFNLVIRTDAREWAWCGHQNDIPSSGNACKVQVTWCQRVALTSHRVANMVARVDGAQQSRTTASPVRKRQKLRCEQWECDSLEEVQSRLQLKYLQCATTLERGQKMIELAECPEREDRPQHREDEGIEGTKVVADPRVVFRTAPGSELTQRGTIRVGEIASRGLEDMEVRGRAGGRCVPRRASCAEARPAERLGGPHRE